MFSDEDKDSIQVEVLGKVVDMQESLEEILEIFCDMLPAESDEAHSNKEDIAFIGGGVVMLSKALSEWNHSCQEVLETCEKAIAVLEKQEEDLSAFEDIIVKGLNNLPTTSPFDDR